MPAPRVSIRERGPPEVVVGTATAAGNYNGPVASRPARAAAQHPSVPVVAAPASPSVTLAAMPRRNVGCGLWPIGSDADRACASRRWGREDLTLTGMAKVTQQGLCKVAV